MSKIFNVILVLSLVISVYLLMQTNRYSMHTTNAGLGYKLDHKTGKVWLISPSGEEKLAKEKKEKANTVIKMEDIAIKYAKNAYSLSSALSNEAQIERWLQNNEDIFEIIGWQAEKKKNGTYLVSFTRKEGENIVGYFFEVNVPHKIVREVKSNNALGLEYGIIQISKKADSTYQNPMIRFDEVKIIGDNEVKK